VRRPERTLRACGAGVAYVPGRRGRCVAPSEP
jgi:hypothetical protein